MASLQDPAAGYVFDKWVLVSGAGSLANADDPGAATFTVGAGPAELQATFTAVQSGSERTLAYHS